MSTVAIVDAQQLLACAAFGLIGGLLNKGVEHAKSEYDPFRARCERLKSSEELCIKIVSTKSSSGAAGQLRIHDLVLFYPLSGDRFVENMKKYVVSEVKYILALYEQEKVNFSVLWQQSTNVQKRMYIKQLLLEMHVNMEPYTNTGNIASIICHDYFEPLMVGVDDLEAYGKVDTDALFAILRNKSFAVFPTQKEFYDNRDDLAYAREIPLVSVRAKANAATPASCAAASGALREDDYDALLLSKTHHYLAVLRKVIVVSFLKQFLSRSRNVVNLKDRSTPLARHILFSTAISFLGLLLMLLFEHKHAVGSAVRGFYEEHMEGFFD